MWTFRNCVPAKVECIEKTFATTPVPGTNPGGIAPIPLARPVRRSLRGTCCGVRVHVADIVPVGYPAKRGCDTRQGTYQNYQCN